MLYFHCYSGFNKVHTPCSTVVPQALIIQVFTVKECFRACWLVKSYTLEMSWKHVKMSWWWFSFGSNFVKKLFQKWASKTVNVIVKTNQQQLIFQGSKLCALINPRIKWCKNVKKKFCINTTHLQCMVPLEIWTLWRLFCGQQENILWKIVFDLLYLWCVHRLIKFSCCVCTL